MTAVDEARPAEVPAKVNTWETEPDSHRIGPKAASALAFFIRSTLRPKWSWQGIMDALEELRDEDPELVAAAAVFCAADEDNRSPVRIAHRGAPHWEKALAGRKIVRPDGVDYTPDCPDHPGVKSTECAPCRAKIPLLKPGESKVRSAEGKRLREWAAYERECELAGIDPGPRPF